MSLLSHSLGKAIHFYLYVVRAATGTIKDPPLLHVQLGHHKVVKRTVGIFFSINKLLCPVADSYVCGKLTRTGIY